MKTQVLNFMVVFSSLTAMAISASAYQTSLCNSNETSLFTCTVRHQSVKKNASVCYHNTQDQVTYRFGKGANSIEKQISIDPVRGQTGQSAKGVTLPSDNSYLLQVKFDDVESPFAYEVMSSDHGWAAIVIQKNRIFVQQLNCEGDYQAFDLDQLRNAFRNSENFESY